MRNVLVQVLDSSGRPAQRERVSIWVYQFLAGGVKEQQTDSNGEAEFSLEKNASAKPVRAELDSQDKYRSRWQLPCKIAVHSAAVASDSNRYTL